MAFERKKTKKTVVIEELESDKDVVRRVFDDLVEEFDPAEAFNKCTNFTKINDCDKCKLRTQYTLAPPSKMTGQDNTSCALIAMKRLVIYIHKNMRKD